MVEKRIEKLLAAYIPFPMCIVNGQGKVTRANGKIDEVFIYDGIQDAGIFTLTGIKFQDLLDSKKDLTISRNEKIFKILTVPLSAKEDSSVAIYFLDVTEQETLKSLYAAEKLCLAVMQVDNYDELISVTSEGRRYALMTEVDKAIRIWGQKLNASVTRFSAYKYFFAMERGQCAKLVENKFQILDEIRNIETEADFPVTLSIGIGAGGKNPAHTGSYAEAALDLALGRGGDQAVFKDGEKIDYFGGKSQTVEKGNKGKSRIVGHALKQLIIQADKVLIMGHKNPDMDAFGAALGIFRFVATNSKEAHIVINNYNETLADVYLQAKESEQYSFINSEKAIQSTTQDSLVIVLDTHRPSRTECPELLNQTDKIVVIDHHRRAEEFIENPTLAYIEPYASSTSELVTEILQYVGDKKGIQKLEVEALLAGITVDTNRFSVKTGVRTFEAASWLRRAGADTTMVKRLFQSDEVSFKIKASCVASARFIEKGMALSFCIGTHPNMQVINAQAADELLEVKGVRASFVVGTDEQGKTIISARSLGEVNVQVIMEAFDGGGHLNTAGAQVDESPEEVMEKLEALLKHS